MGVNVVMATIFYENEDLDLEKVKTLPSFLIEH
jgi:hypothetical protein